MSLHRYKIEETESDEYPERFDSREEDNHE